MKKILLTGFGDWAGSNANPAGEVAHALNGVQLEGASIRSVIAPSVFKQMAGCVTDAIDADKPDIVLMMGEYNGRTMITVERVAQNFIDATRYGFGDEAGDMPQDEAIVPDGPYAYPATVPLRAMVRAMRDAGVPADISDTAATFGCNLLMYSVLHYISKKKLPIRAGWVHLPSLPATAALDKNVGLPSMALETQIAGLKAGIVAAAAHATDIDAPISSRLQI
ncbi:pyroglutamyl-peptidase I [Cerasicoccus arenae]|uniref:Pyrrolidone-carboxylate peptidase n=1 Tax=Cerasicoccus arenae TaxID=424488 RepID=A0A8J3GF90_9BACT|nr:pyroglutamyl-peptidase I [Cerasicoccus arenae]MBK1857897.1 pyroglutamyl-peptidase I [Cerasicoccus arenae]GHC09529.1 pyrrolidone-carboxylate peptidase [Cerasicoccus arenae]